MSDLDLRYVELEAARTALGDVLAVFSAADGDAEEAAATVGHDALAGKVRDFSEGWNSRRRVLERELTDLADVIGAVADTFSTLDQKFGAELSVQEARP